MNRRRVAKWGLILGVPVAAVAGVVAFWNWDWFIPLADSRASAALGRRVSIGHLHVQLGRVTTVSADDVRIDNPEGFPADPPFATARRLSAQIDLSEYIRHRQVILPRIDIDQPRVEVLADKDGHNNYTFDFGKSGDGGGAPPKLGALTIEDGTAHVAIPKLRADFTAAIATREGDATADGQATSPVAGRTGDKAVGQAGGPSAGPGGGAPQPGGMPPSGGAPQVVVDAKGTYAGQPITGRLIGGGILTLRDAAQPYPVDLRIANGPTRVTLVGTVQNPLSFAGADLKLDLSGPNMALLEPLTGVPIPKTPAYKVTGQLDYADHRIRFRDFAGTLGNSDIGGTIAVDPGKERPDVTADLHSRRVDLADLGGFIGEEPGRSNERNATPEQRAQVARKEAGPRLLPDEKLNLPKLRSADVHLKYRGEHIEGHNVPIDSVAATVDIVGGDVSVHPISLGIGAGQVGGTIALSEKGQALHAKADIDVRRVDLGRVLGSAGVRGAGLVNGRAEIDGTGSSIASIMANGNGGLSLYLSGGNLSALLVDLAGLEFGNAVLSALGIPQRAQLECFAGDWLLRQGVMTTRALYVDTSSAVIRGTGTIDLRNERLGLQIKSDAKHFTIGSLPAPINVGGTLKHPGVMPDIAALGLRGGAAVGLGILAGPLGLLPTIQLGTGDDPHCEAAVAAMRRGGGAASSAGAKRDATDQAAPQRAAPARRQAER